MQCFVKLAITLKIVNMMQQKNTHVLSVYIV